MAELRSLKSETFFDIQGSANFTTAQFVAKCRVTAV